METRNPSQKGIVTVSTIDKGSYQVNAAVEKPTRTSSKLAIEPVYVFKPTIFSCLRETPAGFANQIQLTDAINRLANMDNRVFAVELVKETRLNIGDTESYGRALQFSFRVPV
jgi:UTP--glucose-1-phosphate uridylyltransferase